MSVALKIEVRNNAGTTVGKLVASFSEGGICNILAPRLAEFVGGYISDCEPNKNGWPSTNFYIRAARSIDWVSAPKGFVLRINQVGMRQRYYGGPIHPLRARALTIPISAEAYGHRAAEFPGLFRIGDYLVRYQDTSAENRSRPVKITRASQPRKLRRAMIPYRHPSPGRGVRSRRLQFLFKLRESVMQDGDPGILPDERTLSDKALAVLNDLFSN